MSLKLLTPKRLFKIHGWLGMNLGLLLFVICFSGTVAVFSQEIDWLLNPSIRVTPGEQRTGWETIHANIQAAHPGSQVQWMDAPLGSRFAQEAVIETPSGQLRRVYSDPYTGLVQGDTSYFNTQRFFRSFHRRMFVGDLPWLPDSLYIICFFGFVLLFSAITGLLFYKKWWQHLFRLRLHKSRRVFFSDLHRFVGVWTLLFSVLISLTGIWYFAEEGLRDTDIYDGPSSPRLRATPPSAEAQALPLDSLVAIAQEAYPSLEIKQVRPPAGPRNPLVVAGQADAWLVRDRVNAVSIDPYSGQVLDIQRGEELAALDRWTHTADPLHFGTFGGLAIKTIWFVLGLVLSLSILGGAYLWRLRTMVQGASLGDRLCNRASLGLTTAFLLLSAYKAYHGILNYGPADDGTIAPEVPLGVTLFIAGFILLTLGVIVGWYWIIFAAPGRPARQGNDAPRHVTHVPLNGIGQSRQAQPVRVLSEA